MSWSKEQYQQKLKELYDVEFPDALFGVHEFMISRTQSDDKSMALSVIGLYPAGPLELILEFDDLLDAKFIAHVLLHYRYYRDVPEFFTCLTGECDGEHWGMLLDEPTRGFRGVASYYNNDGDEIVVYKSLFDAILSRCDERTSSCQEWISESDDSEEIADYQRQIEDILQFRFEFEKFLAKSSLLVDEDRPEGLFSDTGLSVIKPENFNPDTQGEAIAALAKGRSLWYWYGEEHSSRAYKLLRGAYLTLERYELIRLLDIHYQNRSNGWVDLLENHLARISPGNDTV
ncbi:MULTISPECIES: ADP-ribosylation family protein [Cyanophyceae]|uniref:ADP-ribosylation family protein n=1 Tax=Cyanophyceae TaxID=3028117 RepID=UPI001683CED6|nr:ADP-ribosylation family protein [Trichocoleus sp. FACHB-40]MBD2001867.1 DUF2228 domain-containing protein [Trichocoleus sp. FACHB-40]